MMCQQKNQRSIKEKLKRNSKLFQRRSGSEARKSELKMMNKTFIIPTFYSLENGEINKVHHDESKIDINKTTILPNSESDCNNDMKLTKIDQIQHNNRSVTRISDGKWLASFQRKQ